MNEGKIVKKIVKMHRIKKTYFLFCVYKMVEITQQTWGKNSVEVITFNGKKRLSETNIKDQLIHLNLAGFTLQYSSELRKQRQE